MTDKQDGGSAFPVDREYLYQGMTLRDWFAGQALAGLIASCTTAWPPEEVIAGTAYEVADAMLAARGK